MENEALVAIVVDTETREGLAKQASKADTMLDALRALEDEREIAEFLTCIKSEAKELEDKRTSITKPLHQAKTAVDALFRPAKQFYLEAEAILKSKLAEIQAQREALRLQAINDSARGEHTALTNMAAAEKIEGISYRYGWEYDIENLDEVPREWLTLDHSKVKIYLRKFTNSDVVPPVPGLNFNRSRSVVARGR